MMRVIVRGCAVLAVLALTYRCRAEEAETFVRLEVSPAPAPRPSLKYQLLPEFQELNPGNPCLGYLKCFTNQQALFFNKDEIARREKWLTMPLKELRAKEIVHYGGFVPRYADHAARLDTPDWQVLLTLKAEGAATLLPDVMEIRSLANVLMIRFRAEIALGKFDDAIRSAKTLLALARHLDAHPTMVGALTGQAIVQMAFDRIEELIQQPGCPNLYWALTNLPVPLITLARGTAGERDIFLDVFRGLDESAAMSDEQIKIFIAPLDPMLSAGNPIKPGDDVASRLVARTRDQKTVNDAIQRLEGLGFSQERLKTFPPKQIILLDEKFTYEERRDEILRLLSLPLWQTYALARQIAPVDALGDDPSRPLYVKPFLEALLPVPRSRARLDRRIALLRHVEGLRMFADAHGGTLPESLSQVPVPLPDDPFTGKPFSYTLQKDKGGDGRGDFAELRGNPPPGDEEDGRFRVRYNVRIRR